MKHRTLDPRRRRPGLLEPIACAALVVLTIVLVALPAPARADPRSDFFCRMLTNPDPRVRTSAALRLAELRAPESVDAVLAALAGEADVTSRAALIAALGAIADPRALDPVERCLHDPAPAVRAQAQRAIAALRAAARAARATESAPVAPRYVIGFGAFGNSTRVRDAEVREVARRSLAAAIAARPEVAPDPGSVAALRTLLQRRHLRGYFIDGNVRTLETRGSTLHAVVSLVVQTHPGREYRFEAEARVAVPMSDGAGPGAVTAAEDQAVRRAVESAFASAIAQLDAAP